MNLQEDLTATLEKELGGLGFELVKADISSQGRRRILRLYIDRAETGVTIDDCVHVSRALGLVLDDLDIMSGPYNLEVSSPGMNRALTRPEHYKRFAGREIKIEYFGGDGEKRTVIGVIKSSDAGSLVLSEGDDDVTIEYDRINRANLHGEKWDIGKKDRKRK